MSRLSEKIKIVYLTLVILFSMGVFAYLLDTWHIIKLKDHIPFLKHEPPVVGEETDDASLRKEEQLQKEEQRLQELELKLKEAEAKLGEQTGNVQKQQEEIELMRKGLAEERKKLEEQKQAAFQRQKTVKEMSGRLLNMPPDDAVAICANWSNADVVDVFLQMERDAEAEGRQSIVPFLLTKLPRERAGVITTLMMDERARMLPDTTDGPAPESAPSPAPTPAP
ncbi:MAG TPA: hypothetical protein PKE49_19630 [Leptospiraceae bacterium]|jgi:flagellar protein FlbB|nr:hypothetical protein [Leptospirales bacterium]HMU83575.1 hypothetical protein [Leptospiraceae bacterium]HMW58794.1 hypothetical protein [Leptospiraceae bacterium]HMX58748.1 hypothetical protein [Leptospiraceae bacterium]HMZ37622.1 hypothetical protein [Leptospiraceae bacterium]